MNQTQIARLAAAANMLRPDWPTASLHTFLETELAARPWRDVASALAYVACDEETRTPRRVLEAGPWWNAGSDPTPRPPRHDEQCPHHAGNYREGCHGCAADQKAGTDSPSRPMEQRRVTVLAGQVRQALRTATASKCSHGIVPPAVCNEPHDQPAEETT